MATKKRVTWPAVLVDTREQRPYDFKGDLCAHFGVTIETQRGTLDTGDYALVEHPEIARIERKSLGDFVGSVTHDHDRFFREMERLADYPIAAVIVEGELGEIVSRTREAYPQSVVCSAMKIATDFRIPIIYAASRPWAEYHAAWMLRRAHEKRMEARPWVAKLAERLSQMLTPALDWSP